MKRGTSKVPDLKPESDKAKRVYRAALDTIRRLDDIVKQKKACRDVFLPDAISLRSRLQDYCERLMFYDPLEYGRKAEELLWRKVYYDVIQLLKHNKKQMRPSSSLESAFRTHLSAATGYYHHLLFKLQTEFNLRLEGIVDFYHVPEPRAHRKPHQTRKGDPDPDVKEWACRACHRCLVYLGDIARYQQDYDGARSRVAAQRYYCQALALYPDIGMPHNQLGTLAGTRYYSLDAAYHYLRCLSCDTSFDGAQGNLFRLFEKNRRRYIDISSTSPRDLPPDQQRSKDIKRSLVRFMHLLDVLHTTDHSLDAKGIQDCCQTTLQDFNQCLFYQPPQPADNRYHDDKVHYLEDEMVFKIIVICMITIQRLQEAGNKQVTAAIAFSLALFSHILNHVVIRLQSALYDLENPRKVINLDSEENRLTTTDDDLEGSRSSYSDRTPTDQSETRHKDEKIEKKKQKLHKLRHRRRRRVGSDSSSGSDQRVLSDDSDLSEGDIDNVGDISDSASDDEGPVYLHTQSDDSDSDSEDNLMVSQELRPGFSQTEAPPTESGGDGSGGLPNSFDLLEGFGSGTESLNSSLNSLSSAMISEFNSLNNSQKKPPLPDMGELLEEFPMDWLSDASNFFDQTLKVVNLLNHNKVDENEVSDSMIGDVMEGKKEVSVPPGFEKSDESQHVMEITEKMANFVIETDTDTSNLATDTDNSTIATESEMETETETDVDSVVDKTELEERRIVHLLSVISNEGLLSSIKVYCDWMKCNPQIIATCAKSSQSLWSRLSVLLNFLPLESDLAKIEMCKSDGVLKMVEKASTREWTATQPLCEDIHLEKLAPLEEVQTSLEFTPQKRLDLTQEQEAILRICYLRKFGYFVAKMKSIRFSFDKDKGMFYGPLQLQSQQDEKDAQEKMADAEARRNQLMKDMAQLRLQAEVSQLEGDIQSTDQQHSLPPYLVLDASVLCDSLQLIRQLANSARFIIIIPLAVIDHLDYLKKESTGAREAIRWLEGEFKKGNRYVRAQKSHEKSAALPQKNLKKKDKDAWRFMQIVDCAKYLAQQSTDCTTLGMVSVLTNHTVTSSDVSIRVKQAISLAKQDGMIVQNAKDFHSKWKEVWKNSKG